MAKEEQIFIPTNRFKDYGLNLRSGYYSIELIKDLIKFLQDMLEE